ncbi:MAG: hypothetical protein QW478_02040 [Candidatus Micrarchaeaceae archaeon]
MDLLIHLAIYRNFDILVKKPKRKTKKEKAKEQERKSVKPMALGLEAQGLAVRLWLLLSPWFFCF